MNHKAAGVHERAVEMPVCLPGESPRTNATAAILADDVLDFGVFGGVPRSWDDGRDCADVLATCQELLGSEHPVTQEVHRLVGAVQAAE